MNTVFILEKGRPPLPDGARRQHVQMRNGKPTKVWVKKFGNKWVYDGMVDPKHSVSRVGKKSTVRKKHEESKKQKKLMDDMDLSGAVQMTEEEFKTNPPEGFAYDSKLSHEADRHSTPGKITVGPKFFALPFSGKKHTLLHELSHTLESGLSPKGVDATIQAPQDGVFTGQFPADQFNPARTVEGINGQTTPLENLTEAYTVLLDDPDFLKEHYPKAYDYVKKLVSEAGLPTEGPEDLNQTAGLSTLSDAELLDLQKRFTRRDRIGEGQEVKYHGKYFRDLQGKTGKLVAIGPSGFAMVQYPGGRVETAAWRDITPVGKVKPHSLYDGLDAKNVYKMDGKLKEVLDKTMKQKIGNSGMNYYDLANEFKKNGFNLQVVGGTVRDILGEKGEIKDVDFIFNGTDRELYATVKAINPAWVRGAVTNKHLGLVSFKDGSDVVDITPVHKYSPEMNDMAKGWNLKDDATSRDLAMNSLQVDPLTGIMCDPTGNGIKDIKENSINFCNTQSLKIAPRYVLRAFKFISRGYKTNPETDKAIHENLKYVSSISPRRRESFVRRQIGDKDGLKGLENFKKVFKSYNANIWNREFEHAWRSVYRQMGGKP